MNIDQIISRLHSVKETSTGFVARCPAHNDGTPSLSITSNDDGIAFHCFAGCKTEAICDRIGIKVKDLFFKELNPIDSCIKLYDEKVVGKRAGRWDYYDKTGLVCVVLRYDTGTSKEFRPISKINGEWKCKGLEGLRPLYNLLRINDDTVFVVEGEKCADSLVDLGFVAVTSLNGSQSPAKTDWSPLTGKNVIIIPDNDGPGFMYADKVKSLIENAKSVKIIKLTGLQLKEDIYDFIQKHGEDEAKKQLLELISKEDIVTVQSDNIIDTAATVDDDEEQTGMDLSFNISEDLLNLLPTTIKNTASYLATQTSGKIEARHILMAISICGGIIGKQAIFSHWASDYYTNTAICILEKSGSGKSNLRKICSRLLAEHDTWPSEYSTATIEGIVSLNSIKIIGETPQERNQKEAEAINKAKLDKATIIVADEMLGLFGSMIRKDDAGKCVRMLCQMMDNSNISHLTKTNGFFTWGDVCVSILGMSTVDSFNDTIRTPALKEQGLAGRIIPVNGSMIKWDMPLKDSSLCYPNLGKLSTFINTIHHKIKCYFTDDAIQNNMIIIKQKYFDKHIKDMFEHDWEEIMNKIRIQSAKIAMTFAVSKHIEDSQISDAQFISDQIKIDATQYMELATEIVYLCHLSNMYYIATVGREVEKITSTLKIKGAMTERDLYTYLGWDSWKIKQLVAMTIESGDVERINGKRKGVIKYQVVKNKVK